VAAVAAVVLVVAASVSSGLPGNATRVTAPGTATITLAEPGTYTISYEFPPGTREVFVLQRTATEHLPTSVDAYLALPASYATTAMLRDGRTALQILGDQLGLLDVEVGEIGDAVRRRDSERLLVHRRFLEQVFGRGSNELELPPPE
jgi:hypothetical protein